MTPTQLRKHLLRLWISLHDAPPPRQVVRQMRAELRRFLAGHPEVT